MNKRLQAIADLVSDGIGLVDVGTDHGALPISLASRGYSGELFATDINAGPLSAGERNASAASLDDRIWFLLCDGLERCPADRVDTIVIAGMGGDTIAGILDRAEWTMDRRYQLILQPMTKGEVLRYWLVNNGYGIDRELLVRDSGTIYAILSARYGGETRLSDGELFTGSRPLICSDPLWPEYREGWSRRIQRMVDGMRMGDRDDGKQALFEQILQEWEENSDDDRP